jgi:hypothetical protein
MSADNVVLELAYAFTFWSSDYNLLAGFRFEGSGDGTHKTVR